MKVMTFRSGSGQLRNLLLAAIGCAAVSAAILVGHFAAHVDLGEGPLGLGIGLGLASVLVSWVLIGYRRAFTECSLTGIRARGLTGPVRHYRWDQVEEIAIRRSNPTRGPPTREAPSAPAPAAVACADYSAWALAQTDDGPPGRDPALLTYAKREAPAGQLSADLHTLDGDVSMAIGAGETDAGLVAQMAVVHDMQSVSKDCS